MCSVVCQCEDGERGLVEDGVQLCALAVYRIGEEGGEGVLSIVGRATCSEKIWERPHFP